MAGYNGFSKSNNAEYAEYEGRYPLTEAKKHLAKLLKITQSQAAFVLKQVGTSEWHHTSSHYNTTDYYDVETIAADLEPEQIAKYLERFEAENESKKETRHENCRVEWIEWGGSRRRPTATKRESDSCTVIDKGGCFVTVVFPDGKEMKKKKDANGFSFTNKIK